MSMLSIGSFCCVCITVSYLEKRMQIKRCHLTQQIQRLHVSENLASSYFVTPPLYFICDGN